MVNDKLSSFNQLQQTAVRVNQLIGKVANAAVEAIEGVASGLPVVYQVTLINTAWTGDTIPYIQTVSIPNVKANEAGQIVQVTPASESLMKWINAMVLCVEQGAGTLTFSCTEKPSENIVCFVVLQEVLG